MEYALYEVMGNLREEHFVIQEETYNFSVNVTKYFIEQILVLSGYPINLDYTLEKNVENLIF